MKEESSENGEEWEDIEDDVFDPADSIFGSDAHSINPLHEQLDNSKQEESKQAVFNAAN